MGFNYFGAGVTVGFFLSLVLLLPYPGHGVCDNQCSGTGEGGCSSDYDYWYCQQTVYDCYIKSEVTCQWSDMVCGNGQCIDPASCTNECSSGQTGCIGTVNRWVCTQNSVSGCWYKKTGQCSSGQTCTSGECIACTNECSPGEDGCTNSNTRWACELQGDGCYDRVDYACDSDETCSDGSCISDRREVTYGGSSTGVYGLYSGGATYGGDFGFYCNIPSGVSKAKIGIMPNECLSQYSNYARITSPCTAESDSIYDYAYCTVSVTPGQRLEFDASAYWQYPCSSTNPGGFNVKVAEFTCENECSSGQTGCSGTSQRWYCTTDTDGCYVKKYASCSSGYACQNGKCAASVVCGDGTCSSGENCSSCPSDCSCPSGWCCSPGAATAGSTGCVRSGYRIDYSYVCCSGTKYSGDCCDDYGCTIDKICSNHRCTASGGGTKGLCEECAANSDCQSNYCITLGSGKKACALQGAVNTCCGDGHHIANKAAGVDCCSDSDCNAGYGCTNYKCAEEGAGNSNGEYCTYDSECQSGNCNYVCCEAGKTCCRWDSDCMDASLQCNTDYHYCWQPPGQCSPGCRDEWLEDGTCDTYCDTPECNFDGGDCPRSGRCSNDDFCDSSEGENCENCPNECDCATYQCCAPDSSDADSRGCVAPGSNIDWEYKCCDGSKEYGPGKTCEEIWSESKKPYGAGCASHDECKSGRCSPDLGICCGSGTCCRDHNSCGADYYCSDQYVCEQKLGAGAYCNLNVECKSGKCWNSECYEEAEPKTYGEVCQGSYECGQGLACKKGRVTSRMYCCPGGNEYCCSSDDDCTENRALRDYYCYKGTEPNASRWFSCQPDVGTIQEQEHQARRLSGAEKGGMGESCGKDDDCWTGHCSNGYCCGWGTCCSTNSGCSDGACVPKYYRCVTTSSEDIVNMTQENFENTLEQRVESKHIEDSKEDMLGLEANFYISTPTKEGKGIVGKKLTSILVIGNRGDENIYVKALIHDRPSHVQNERHEISHWDPGKDKTWLESMPVIGWVVNVLKQINTWLWMTVQDLWFKDDEGFFLITPGTVMSITYEFEPTTEGDYIFGAEMRYYSKAGGGEIFTHNTETNTYEMKEIKDITTKTFRKTITVRQPDCGLLGLICS